MSSIAPAMRSKIAAILGTAVAVMLAAGDVQALTIADAPLFLTQSAEPLVMLTLSNDEQLYHKAYTDFDDVDGDRLIDTTYKDTFNYTGYFDPKKCYSYSGAIDNGQFNPTAIATCGPRGRSSSAVYARPWMTGTPNSRK